MSSDPERKNWVGRSNQPPQPECCREEGQAKTKPGVPTEQPPGGVHRDKHGPQAGVARRLSNPASKQTHAGGDDVASSEPNMTLTVEGEVSVGLPGSKVLKAWLGTWEARWTPAAPTPGAKREGKLNDKESLLKESRESDWPI